MTDEQEKKDVLVKFDTSQGRVTGILMKENKMTVWVEYDGPRKRSIIRRHKIKHNVEVLNG